MKEVPTRGADSVWFRLAAAAQQLKEEIEPTLIQRIAFEKWTETLLDAAAHPNEIIRNHAVAALEKMGELALDAALERAEALNLSWFEERNSWPERLAGESTFGQPFQPFTLPSSIPPPSDSAAD